jgi:ATP synthase subunit D
MGLEATRRLASCGSLSEALRMLADTRYGANIRPEQSLAAAQRKIVGTLLWDLRVLAGWLPGEGVWLLRTRQVHAAALEAAVRYAGAAEALRVVEAETLATRYRLRAIEDRWIPRLEQALADVTFALEEQELADAARLRLAVSPERRPEAR